MMLPGNNLRDNRFMGKSDLIGKLRKLAVFSTGNGPIAVALTEAADEIEQLKQVVQYEADVVEAATAEIERLQTEAADARNDALRLHRDKIDLFDQNIALRAALKEILHLHDTDTDADTYTTLALIAKTAQDALNQQQRDKE